MATVSLPRAAVHPVILLSTTICLLRALALQSFHLVLRFLSSANQASAPACILNTPFEQSIWFLIPSSDLFSRHFYRYTQLHGFGNCDYSLQRTNNTPSLPVFFGTPTSTTPRAYVWVLRSWVAIKSFHFHYIFLWRSRFQIL